MDCRLVACRKWLTLSISPNLPPAPLPAQFRSVVSSFRNVAQSHPHPSASRREATGTIPVDNGVFGKAWIERWQY